MSAGLSVLTTVVPAGYKCGLRTRFVASRAEQGIKCALDFGVPAADNEGDQVAIQPISDNGVSHVPISRPGRGEEEA